jgi:hypothetical protein
VESASPSENVLFKLQELVKSSHLNCKAWVNLTCRSYYDLWNSSNTTIILMWNYLVASASPGENIIFKLQELVKPSHLNCKAWVNLTCRSYHDLWNSANTIIILMWNYLVESASPGKNIIFKLQELVKSSHLNCKAWVNLTCRSYQDMWNGVITFLIPQWNHLVASASPSKNVLFKLQELGELQFLKVQGPVKLLYCKHKL